MADQDVPAPIQPAQESRRSCPEVLLEWAMETCGVEEPAELLYLVDDDSHSLEAAAGVFWYCQHLRESTYQALLRFTADRLRLSAPDFQWLCSMWELLREAERCTSAVDETRILSQIQNAYEEDEIAFAREALCALKKLSSFDEGRDRERQELQRDLRERVLGSLVSEETPEVGLLLSAGLLTLLVQETLARPDTEGSIYYHEDVQDALKVAGMNRKLADVPDGGSARIRWSEDELSIDDELGFSLAAACCVADAEDAAFRASEGDYEYGFIGLGLVASALSRLGLFFDGLVIPHLGAPFGWVSDTKAQDWGWHTDTEGSTRFRGIGLSWGIEKLRTWYEALLPTGSHVVKNWKDIAFVCRLFADTLRVEGFADVEPEPDSSLAGISSSQLGDLKTYWLVACAHASAQLSPSDLVEELRRRDRERHQERLQKDYFDDGWNRLEETTRESLISAEMAWYEAPRMGGRVLGLLNELRLAFEGELKAMFVKPWQEEIDTIFPAWRDRLGLQAKYADSLYLSDVEKLLRAAGSKPPDDLARRIFVEEPNLSPPERRFVCREMPRYLQDLRRARNQAEHEGTCDAGTLRRLRREALGIGCEGVLPRLARLKQRLTRTGDSRLLPGRS